MSDAVIDSSVLLAILLDEPGADVGAALSAGAAMSAVNLAEVAARMMDKGAPPASVENAVETLAIAIVSFEREDALSAAGLRTATQRLGLSLGDRACLALARRMGTIVYTADRRWAELAVGLQIRLIR